MDALTPARGYRATLMLADSAQVADGKLYVLGGGWTVTGPQPAFAIAGIIEVPWDLANKPHAMRLELIDLDGNAVVPLGADEPVVIEGQFEVGRPPGVRTGAAMPFPFAFTFGAGIPVPTGGHFEWRMTLDGEAHEDWRLAFATRADAQSMAA